MREEGDEVDCEMGLESKSRYVTDQALQLLCLPLRYPYKLLV